MFLTRLAMIFFVVASFSVSAEVYRCEDSKGRLQFSDKPCGENAEVISLETTTSGVGVGAMSGNWSAVIEANRERDKARAIERHETAIARLNREKNAKLSALRAKQARANNNLAGATYRQAIASEIQAVVTDYNARISDQRAIIQDLQRQ